MYICTTCIADLVDEYLWVACNTKSGSEGWSVYVSRNSSERSRWPDHHKRLDVYRRTLLP